MAILGLMGAPGVGQAEPRCGFGPGDLPSQTLGPNDPTGDEIPVDHILVLMQENRSFDHYFGRLPAFGHRKVRGLPKGAKNRDADGSAVSPFHQFLYCHQDVAHSSRPGATSIRQPVPRSASSSWPAW